MKIKKDYLWISLTAILIAIIAVLLVHPIGYNSIPSQKAGDIAKSFITTLYPNIDVSINHVSDMGSFYNVYLSLTFQGKTQPITVSVSKDGKYIGSMREISAILANATQQQQKTKFAPQKKDTPDVKLFVMPFCPFGRPAENSIIPVRNLLKGKANFEIHYIISLYTDKDFSEMEQFYMQRYNLSKEKVDTYINSLKNNSLQLNTTNGTIYVSSLHGKDEAKEVVRELCMWKYYPNKTWDYIWDMNHNCTSDLGTCENNKWETIASDLGMNTTLIQKCYNNDALDLLKKEVSLDKQYQASASPTLIVNGDIYNGNDRSANGYKNAVCLGFTNEPSECSQTLNGSYTPSGHC